MSNDESRNPKPNDEGQDPLFGAFQNLNLRSNNNEQQESSNQGTRFSTNNQGIRSRDSNHNLNIQNNLGHVSLGDFPSPLSASNLRPTQPPGEFSSSPLQKSSNNLDRVWGSLFQVVNIMKSPNHEEFKGLLERMNIYGSAQKQTLLLNLGILLSRSRSIFLGLALSPHGANSLRFLLNRNPGLDELIGDVVCNNFTTLMDSLFGRYLIIPTIRSVGNPRKEIIYKLTYENALLLAEKANGSAALVYVFQEIQGQYRDLIFDLVSQYADRLAFHPYGAYVVENFLTLQNNLRATQAIADKLYGSFIKLAMLREGGYVVVKCMNTEYGSAKVLEEFRRNDREWIRMANDRVGNFVAQNAMSVMKQRGMRDLLREFVDKLRPHFGEMMNGFGKNTVGMIQEEIESWLQVST